MKPSVLPLLLGLLTGCLAMFAVERARSHTPPAPDHVSTRSGQSLIAAKPAPWVPAATLDAATAAARVDAWLAQDASTADAAGLGALLPLLPADQFPRLAEALLARTGGDARARFQQVFDVWVERDPASAARWAGALPDGGALNGKARRLLREQAGLAWARDDIDAALVWAHAQPDAAGEWGVAARIYGQLAQSDPQRALTLAQARGDDSFFDKARKRIYDGWAPHDPAGAIQSLGEFLLTHGEHFYTFGQNIGEWARQDPDAAVRWIFAHKHDDEDGMPSLMMQLGRHGDLSAVANAMLRLPPGQRDTADLGWLAYEWTYDSPSQVKAWLASIEDEDVRGAILHYAAGMSNSEKPWSNLDLVVMLPAGADRNDLLSSRLTEWAKADPDAALAWLKAHDEPAAAAAVQGQLIGELASQDRAAAIAQLQQLPPGQERRTATKAIAAAWAKTSPEEAADWMASLSKAETEDYRHSDWYAVVKPWFAKDPAAARDWINAQADPRLRFEAGTSWTIELLNSPYNHQERAELVMGVNDEQRRNQDMFNVAAYWFQADADGARAWIKASALSQATKDGLLQAYDPTVPRR